MKYLPRSCVAFLLALAILAAMVPATAFAANDESVLKTIRHSATGPAVNVYDRTATLTVPYSYLGDVVNLSSGLDVTYDTSVYSSVVASGGTVKVDGAAVDMIVTYQRTNDATFYTTKYQIEVVRAAFECPTFSGTISKLATLSHSLVFTAADFTSKYTKRDGGNLTSIMITGSNPSFGTLKLGTADYTPGTAVSLADLSSGKLTFVATGAGTVDYLVYAYYASGASEAEAKESVLLEITAARVPPTFTGTISRSMTLPSTTLALTSADFTGKYTKNDGGDLASITITGANPTFGKLRLGNADYMAGSSITLADLTAGRLTFVATGSGSVSYTAKAYASGDATTAIGSVTVTIAVQGSMVDNVTYTTDSQTPVTFDASDFNDVCVDATGENLSYLKFTLPSSSYGKLYYDYASDADYGSTVSSSSKYYRNSSLYLSYVTFVPEPDYYGTVSITYTAYNIDGESYTGVVRVAVEENLGAENVTYTTAENAAVTFDATDFNSVCDDLTGGTLNYVKFTLPSSTYGKLYYNYTSSSSGSAVSSSAKYYRSASSSSSSSLSKVTFVPKSGYSGTVTISYTGYNSDGDSFTGKVVIEVQAVASYITYTVEQDMPVTFKATDFDDACDGATNENLSYVKFTLPSSTYGKLYYNYSASSGTGTSVTASTKYYRSSTSSSLSKVTFVPKAGYSGTVSISYTGCNTDGEVFLGTVKVVVNADDGSSQYFDDVGPSYSWASSAIDYLYKAGVVTGVSTGRYSPAASMTRGDFMLMLVRAFDLKAGIAGNFSDVPVGSYYFNAIAIAKALGIAQGDGGNFRPTSSITRQDAMVLVARTLTVTSVTILPGSGSDLAWFSDRSDVSSYAVSAVSSLVKADIIKGDARRLNPKGNITRAEMAVILYRVLTMP